MLQTSLVMLPLVKAFITLICGFSQYYSLLIWRLLSKFSFELTLFGGNLVRCLIMDLHYQGLLRKNLLLVIPVIET